MNGVRVGLVCWLVVGAMTGCAAPEPAQSTARAEAKANAVNHVNPMSPAEPTSTAPASARDPARVENPRTSAATKPPIVGKRPLPPTRKPSPMDPVLPPNERIAGSTIGVPRQVRAGHMLQGQAPVGSRVEIDGKQVRVDGRGQFTYLVPANAGAQLTVRVTRPAPDSRPPMTLKVDVHR